MTAVIVLFDMLHIDRLSHARPLVQLAHITGHMRIIFNLLEIALKVAVIDRVETNLGGLQTPVCFCVMLSY